MKKNMGATDRRMRIIAAVIIALLYYFDVISGTAAAILLIIAGILVLTSLVKICPLYSLFGITSCRKPE